MTDSNDTTPTGEPTPPTGDGYAQQQEAQGSQQPQASSQPSQAASPAYSEHASYQARQEPPAPPAQTQAAYQVPPAQAPYHTQPIPPTQQTQAHHYQQPASQQHVGTVAYEKKGHGLRTFLLAFAGALVACAIGLGGFAIWQSSNGNSNSGGTSTTLGATTSTAIEAEDEDASLAEVVAEKCLPSVVSVYVYTNTSSSMYGYGYGYGYGSSGSSSSETLTQSALGSGVVLSEDGYIITNYHVVEGADALKVNIEGEEYDAEIVGYDSSSDIAVVKATNASGLTAIEIGDSDTINVGEWVMTIGSPYGYEQSVATGVVSATSRSTVLSDSTTGSTTLYTNLIQTDAAINSGNSGGALVNADGQLVGINTLISSTSGGSEGIGFAIPVNYAVNIAQQIINGETPTHAQLGVTLSTVSSQTAQRYGLSVSSGAYVASVESDSGAAEAGIQVGDIVVAFDGEEVESASDLMLDVRSKNPGDTVTLTVNRSGEELSIEVTLGSDGESDSSSQQQSSSSSLLDQLFDNSSSSDGNAA